MWTDNLRGNFKKFGAEGEDLLYLLTRLEKEQSMSLIYMLGQASKGLGVNIHEGLGYVLENNYEDPNDFEGVTFLFGDHESEVMKMDVFLCLLNDACASYIDLNPKEADTVIRLLGLIRERYSSYK